MPRNPPDNGFSRRQLLAGAGAGAIAGAVTGNATAALVDRSDNRSSINTKVCVVGAGFAGLAAAYALQKAGMDFVVLEARHRVGGRSWTRPIDGGGFVDWGGQWVGPTQTRFNALIDEMGCTRYPSPGKVGDYMVRGIDNRLVPVGDNGPEAAGQDFIDKEIYAKITRLANGISPHAPWEAKDAAELDSTTFAQWLRQEYPNDPQAREWAGVEVGSVPSASPAEISMLQLGWLIHSCESIKALFDFDGGAQQDRVIWGTQPVAQKIADRFGSALKLGKPVRRIVKNDSGVEVYSDGLVVNAKHVIVALPPNLAGAIEYEPSLPTNRMQVTQRWPQGLVIKVSMIYSEPFWAKDGKSGKSFDYTAFMSETADSSNPSDISKAGILTGFVYADKAREILLKPAAERKARLLAEVTDRFGQRAASPVNYHETNWSMQQWTRGCFTGFLTPGATTLFKSAVRDQCGPIHWAGTETATEWPSFIEGAIRSGERAANEIVQNA